MSEDFSADTIRGMLAQIGPGSDRSRLQQENAREWDRAIRAAIEIAQVWEVLSPQLDRLGTPELRALWSLGYLITAATHKEMARR